MVKYANDYIERKPRATLCYLRDPLTMDELLLDRLDLEYTRYVADGLGSTSYAVVQLGDGQVISISKRDHQNGRIEYHDGHGTVGGIIELEYDYGTWKDQNPHTFPEYEDLVEFVMKELRIEIDEVLLSHLDSCGANYDSFVKGFRTFYDSQDKYPRS